MSCKSRFDPMEHPNEMHYTYVWQNKIINIVPAAFAICKKVIPGQLSATRALSDGQVSKNTWKMRPESCSQHLKVYYIKKSCDRCSRCYRIYVYKPIRSHPYLWELAGLTFWLLMVEICVNQICTDRARKVLVVSRNRVQYNATKLRISSINLTLNEGHMCHKGL